METKLIGENFKKSYFRYIEKLKKDEEMHPKNKEFILKFLNDCELGKTITKATAYCSNNPRNTLTPTRISFIDCANSEFSFSEVCRMGDYDVRERHIWKFDFSRLPSCDLLYILEVTTDSNNEYRYAAKIFR